MWTLKSSKLMSRHYIVCGKYCENVNSKFMCLLTSKFQRIEGENTINQYKELLIFEWLLHVYD